MLKTSPLYNGAGKRNTYVVIQQAADGTADTTGQVLPVFTTICSRWAAMKPTTGREFQAAMTAQPLLNAILELPYDNVTSTITPRDRVTLNGRHLNIAAVFNESENNEKIILWIIEEVT